jgi:hypothetical protein
MAFGLLAQPFEPLLQRGERARRLLQVAGELLWQGSSSSAPIRRSDSTANSRSTSVGT